MSPEPSACSFSSVLAAELAAVRERRRFHHLDSEKGTEESSSGNGRPSASEGSLEEVRHEALGEDLVGLAFSGGGIRSATFNLGILQGLADLRLLKYFDYISTVSGGGYIGAWLCAWIKREGSAENVELQLQSSRVKQAEAKRQNLKAGEVFDAEPEPIHHLRSYSNYLTPRLGLLSADSWVLGAIYLRNILLNLVVLVPLLLGLIMSERLLMLLFIMTTDTEYTGPWEKLVWITGQSLTVLMLVLVFLWIRRSIRQIRDSFARNAQSAQNYQWERWYLHCYIMAPLLVLGVLITWLSHAQFVWLEGAANVPSFLLLPEISLWIPMERVWLARLWAGTTMALMMGAFQVLSGFDLPEDTDTMSVGKALILRLSRVALGLLTGFIGGVLVYSVFMSLHTLSLNGEHGPVLALTFGPPLFLGAMILIAFIQVGLISRLWSDPIREWWSSVAAASMIYLCAWIGIFGLSIWGPWIILVLEQKLEGVGAVLGAGWITSIVSGILAIRRSVHGATSWPNRLIVRVVPIIFLVGLVILTAFVTDYFVPVWGFSRTPDEYLQSVEQAQVPTSDRGTADDGDSPRETGGGMAANIRLLQAMSVTIVVLFALTAFASRRIDVNTFSLNALYRNRLARCYLGASRPKSWAADGSHLNRGAPTNAVNCSERFPNPITGLDPHDDFPLSELRSDSQQRAETRREEVLKAISEIKTRQSTVFHRPWYLRGFYRLQNWWRLRCLRHYMASLRPENNYLGPIPVLSTALNLVQGGELAWQERMAESFAFTPFYSGSKTTGYVPTEDYAGGISLARAVAISGAAVSPNMGYHSNRPVTALLTIFNMRLGAWLGNPRLPTWKMRGPKRLLRYLKNELLGLTNADGDFVYLSDGGHFENLGLYELIRRRCRYIVASDSGADPGFTYADLASFIRKVQIDFGIRIQMETQRLTPAPQTGLSECHVAVGKIYYGDVDCFTEENISPSLVDGFDSGRRQFRPERNEGLLIYIKPTITGDETQDVLNYRACSPLFPHEPTTDQWFGESQFESYRALGWHIARGAFGLAASAMSTEEFDNKAFFQRVFQQLRPSPAERHESEDRSARSVLM